MVEETQQRFEGGLAMSIRQILVYICFTLIAAVCVSYLVTDYTMREQKECVKEDSLEATPLSIEARRNKAIIFYSQKLGIDTALLRAVADVENPTMDPLAKSSKGALGLMQVMPFWVGVFHEACGGSDLLDVEENVCYGAHILDYYLTSCKLTSRTRKEAILCALKKYVGSSGLQGEKYASDVIARMGT